MSAIYPNDGGRVSVQGMSELEGLTLAVRDSTAKARFENMVFLTPHEAREVINMLMAAIDKAEGKLGIPT